MRYYSITISDPKTGQVYKPRNDGRGFDKSPGGSTFTSHPQGLAGPPNPGALQIEFDVPAAPFNAPQGTGYLRITGVSLGMIGQASDLNGADIRISAGMGKGLPLANPSQAGPILQGRIYQAYGNWQGVLQTLDLVFYPAAAQEDQNIAFIWPAGTTLATALLTTFTQAFGQYKMQAKINIAKFIQNFEESGHYHSLVEFAGYLQERTQKLGSLFYGQDYSGVIITITGNTIYAYDSAVPRTPTQLDFVDLIGQPTWVNPATVNFKCVLRSDIAVGDLIKFPDKGLLSPYVLISQNAAVPNAPPSSQSAFKGVFQVRGVHHFADFRGPSADSWNTTFDAVQATPPTQSQPLDLLTATLGL